MNTARYAILAPAAGWPFAPVMSPFAIGGRDVGTLAKYAGSIVTTRATRWLPPPTVSLTRTK